MFEGIVRITAYTDDNEDEPSRSTGFLVAPNLMLTAAHAVLQTDAHNTPLFDRYELDVLGHRSMALAVARTATFIAIDDFDIRNDWALVRCEVTPPVAFYTKISKRGDHVAPGSPWHGYGFPSSEPTSGKPIGGVYVGKRAPDAEAPGLHALHGHEASAGEAVPGCSGGPVLVGDEVIGIIRSIRSDTDRQALIAEARRLSPRQVEARASGGTIYATPITDIVERIAAHPGIRLDEAWFVASLTPHRSPLPAEPFRDLRPYNATDHSVYFGRSEATRRILRPLIVSDPPPQLLLAHGTAGAGKSSLIAAGVVPLLASKFTVHLSVQQEQSLASILRQYIELADAAAEPSEKERIVIIDQAERIFRNKGASADCAALFDFVRDLTSRNKLRTLVLSYREEWHARFVDMASRTALIHQSALIEPMNKAEAKSALDSIGPLLQESYGTAIDPGLLNEVYERVARERGSLAPILQVLMTRLWRACERDGAGGPRRLTYASFLRIKDRIGLDHHLEVQLKADDVAAADRGTGLVLSLLRFHTSSDAAVRREPREIVTVFGHKSGAVEVALRALASTDLLLVDDEGGTRLVHDALSKVVCEEWDRSLRPGQRAERRLAAMLHGRSAPGKSVSFSLQDREVIRAGLTGMRRLTKAVLLAILDSAVSDSGDDIGFWHSMAARRVGPEAANQCLLGTTRRPTAGALIVISNDPRLRSDDSLRRQVIPGALVCDNNERRSLGSAIADNLLPLQPFEIEQIERSRGGPNDERAVDLLAWIQLRSGDLNSIPPAFADDVRSKAAQRFRASLATLDAEHSTCSTDMVVATLSWLALAFAICVPTWSRVLGWHGVQTIGNLMPAMAWTLFVGPTLGPWLMRLQIGALATRELSEAWRGTVTVRVFAVTSLALALLVGFAKSGAQVLDRSEYTLSNGFVDAAFSICLSLGATGVAWLTFRLCSAVAFEPRTDENFRARILLRVRWWTSALLLALGTPVMLATAIVWAITQLPTLIQCDLRLPATASAALWVALVTGLGTIQVGMVISTAHAARFYRSRQGMLGPSAHVRGPARASKLALAMMTIALVEGSVLAYHTGSSTVGTTSHTFMDAPRRCYPAAPYRGASFK